jgi:hypothetical protein
MSPLRACAGLVALGLALAAAAADAQSLASVSIDDVRVEGRGRHRVLVSAGDANGAPTPDLERAFRVTLDGQPVADVTARRLRESARRVTVYLVMDGALLGGATEARVREAVIEAARGLAPGDRVEVLAVSDHIRRAGGTAGRVAALADGLDRLAGDATPVLYDALYDAARAASRGSRDEFALVLAVTRGNEAGSRRRLLDVLAMARGRTKLVPVHVTLVGDQGSAAEHQRLERLAAHTAGAVSRVASSSDLPAALRAQVDRGVGRWVLSFEARDWDRRAPRHRLSVAAERFGERRWSDEEYETAAAVPARWWASPRPWVLLALAVAGGLAVLALMRQRVRCLLVHDGDDDDGVWYEVRALPLTLGGASGNDVILGDPRVSRHHAVLEPRGRQVELVDLNSENGTFVNGERITRRVLADGDRMSLGPDAHLVYEARG